MLSIMLAGILISLTSSQIIPQTQKPPLSTCAIIAPKSGEPNHLQITGVHFISKDTTQQLQQEPIKRIIQFREKYYPQTIDAQLQEFYVAENQTHTLHEVQYLVVGEEENQENLTYSMTFSFDKTNCSKRMQLVDIYSYVPSEMTVIENPPPELLFPNPKHRSSYLFVILQMNFPEISNGKIVSVSELTINQVKKLHTFHCVFPAQFSPDVEAIDYRVLQINDPTPSATLIGNVWHLRPL